MRLSKNHGIFQRTDELVFKLASTRGIEMESRHCNCLSNIYIFFFTGTVLFSSKSGSGGGAIELIAENGTLTVGKSFRILITTQARHYWPFVCWTSKIICQQLCFNQHYTCGPCLPLPLFSCPVHTSLEESENGGFTPTCVRTHQMFSAHIRQRNLKNPKLLVILNTWLSCDTAMSPFSKMFFVCTKTQSRRFEEESVYESFVLVTN